MRLSSRHITLRETAIALSLEVKGNLTGDGDAGRRKFEPQRAQRTQRRNLSRALGAQFFFSVPSVSSVVSHLLFSPRLHASSSLYLFARATPMTVSARPRRPTSAKVSPNN